MKITQSETRPGNRTWDMWKNTTEYVTSKYDVIAVKYNGVLNLKIKSSVPTSINLSMTDIWKLSQDLMLSHL